MSPFGGVWNVDGAPVDQVFLRHLTSGLEECGPDGGHAYVDESIAQVQRLFINTSEVQAGCQQQSPTPPDIILWDGRLDNRSDLIRDLSLTQHAELLSDAAIVAASFGRWGTTCLARFRGDWALSIWNKS